MNPRDLKELIEKFKSAADDPAAVTKLAEQTRQNHPTDTEVGDLCNKFKAAASDPDAVRAIANDFEKAHKLPGGVAPPRSAPTTTTKATGASTPKAKDADAGDKGDQSTFSGDFGGQFSDKGDGDAPKK